ncbi:trypsin-like serine protease with PDZ domain [Ligilactobacillus salitolerans]|uniref:Trypsin-like serine protease with PDZ domain n=1 Tax=Ligilactobacillus salitolerans TaxID=1808352 RepID=A0A401IV12_9LACO|nr:PDZ domain-containing protein [Ligilactobacillus salitolerans]GBG95390.1 trypsin-like serine protease with PDZ domain [Ligilactobacillus salitolerans]
MEFLKIILIYLIHPVFWVGIIIAVFLYRKRLGRERKLFRIAINRDFYEGRHFIKTALFGLAAGSIISLAAGMMVNAGWLWVYAAVGTLTALLLPVADLSFSSLWLIGSVFCLAELALQSGVKLGSWAHFIQAQRLPAAGLLLLGIFLVLRWYLLHYQKNIWFSPRIKDGKRGSRVAFYKWKELSVIPLVILVPLNYFHSPISFWPFFSFHGQTFGIVILPLLVAAALRVYKRETSTALKNFRTQTPILGGVSLVASVLALFSEWAAVIGYIVVGCLAGYFYFQRRRFDAAGSRWYVETTSGVRIVAVVPDTPAAKMGLQNGDIILDCNNRAVRSEDELYAALQQNSAYCRLRVQTFAGELKLTESAIYSDSPHEIGLILFQK